MADVTNWKEKGPVVLSKETRDPSHRFPRFLSEDTPDGVKYEFLKGLVKKVTVDADNGNTKINLDLSVYDHDAVEAEKERNGGADVPAIYKTINAVFFLNPNINVETLSFKFDDGVDRRIKDLEGQRVTVNGFFPEFSNDKGTTLYAAKVTCRDAEYRVRGAGKTQTNNDKKGDNGTPETSEHALGTVSNLEIPF